MHLILQTARRERGRGQEGDIKHVVEDDMGVNGFNGLDWFTAFG